MPVTPSEPPAPAPRPGRRCRARSGRSERGSAALEFALVVPVLIMLLLGIVTAGIAYSRGIGLTDAVRQSARFGATGDATVPATWAADVIARERTTQIDDSAKTSAVCVQLYKATSATTGGAVTSVCDQGTFGSTLSVSDPDFPAPPSGLTAGSCVVQVLAARKYSITLAPFPSISGTMKRGAVARYERSSC